MLNNFFFKNLPLNVFDDHALEKSVRTMLKKDEDILRLFQSWRWIIKAAIVHRDPRDSRKRAAG